MTAPPNKNAVEGSIACEEREKQLLVSTKIRLEMSFLVCCDMWVGSLQAVTII
jgi:hypothetical protein